MNVLGFIAVVLICAAIMALAEMRLGIRADSRLRLQVYNLVVGVSYGLITILFLHLVGWHPLGK